MSDRRLASMIKLEEQYLGYQEGAGNHTIFGAEIGAQNQPWCASYQSDRLKAAGFAGHSSASAQALVESFPTGHTPRVGALVGFHMPGGHSGINHVGFVTAVLSGSRIATIEGNTSDMVARRVRSRSLVVCYGYVPYVAAKPAPMPARGLSASLTPGNPLYHTRIALRRDAQGWNSTIGTKRRMLGRGGVMAYLGNPVTKNGNKYAKVANGDGPCWVRYDWIRWI